MNPGQSPEQVIGITRCWIEQVVIGLDLCPFAAEVVRKEAVLYRVSEAFEVEALYRDLLETLDALQRQDEQQIRTGFLILSQGLPGFQAYLEFLEIADQALADAELEGIIQIAGFHPEYQFSESAENDSANYTNRSPYPMLHLIREDDLEAAVASHPDPAGIPARNVSLLRELGVAEMRRRLQSCFTMP